MAVLSHEKERIMFAFSKGVRFGIQALITLCALVGLAQGATAPTFVRFRLAGIDLRDGKNLTVYDARQRYFLVATDVDGEYDLEITPNLGVPVVNSLDDMEHNDPHFRRRSLPLLWSGRGVDIGDSPEKVQYKLQSAPTMFSYDRETKERIYVYRARIGVPPKPSGLFSRDGKRDYTATYTFHQERLWAIQYNLVWPPNYIGDIHLPAK